MQGITAIFAAGLAAGLVAVAVAAPAPPAPSAPPAADGAAAEHGWQEHGRQEHGWHHRRGAGMQMFRELGLTDAQRASVRSIVEAARPDMQSLRERLRANERQLRETSPDDRNYAQVVARVSQDNGALETQLIAQRAKVFAQVYALLAPIQKTRLAEVQARRARWMERHREHLHERMHEHTQEHMQEHEHEHGNMSGDVPPA